MCCRSLHQSNYFISSEKYLSPIKNCLHELLYMFNRYPLKREDAIKILKSNLRDRDVVISTTGMLSRELFEHRKEAGQGHERDFLTVGSMGHASSIALGIALSRPQRQASFSLPF
jgi:thiamine pyrophosphate-dependent acetolactate synthase large subunit-like protein